MTEIPAFAAWIEQKKFDPIMKKLEDANYVISDAAWAVIVKQKKKKPTKATAVVKPAKAAPKVAEKRKVTSREAGGKENKTLGG